MIPTIPAGKLFGVPVRIGVSWLLIAPLAGVGLYLGVPGSQGSTLGRALVAAAGALLVLASVVVHEVGHIVAARRRRVPVERLNVFMLGGYSDIDLDAQPPEVELAVAGAGPFASILAAAALSAVTLMLPDRFGTVRTARVVILVNGAVAAFNLLPAFPLDGGRMVRALLMLGGWTRRRAEAAAARLGIILGLVLFGVGVFALTRDSARSILAIPAGVLLVAVSWAARPRPGPKAKAMMAPVAAVLSERDPAGEARPAIVVVGDRVVGIVVSGPATNALAGEVMGSVLPGDIAAPGDRIEGALQRRLQAGRSLVVIEGDRLLGVVLPPQ